MNYEQDKRKTRRQFLKLAGAAMLTPLIVSCETHAQQWARLTSEQDAILLKRGLNGQHKLLDLKSVQGFALSGEISGGGFVFIGALQGDIEGQTTQNAWFAWETNGNDPLIVISHLPLDKVAFIQQSDKKEIGKEVVFFDFNEEKLITTKGELSLNYRPFDSSNPNDFIDPSVINIAKITLPASEILRLLPLQ